MIFEKTDQNATYRYALNVPVQNLVWESVVIQEKQIFDVNVFVKMEQFCMLESVFLKIQIKFKIRMNASQKMTAEPELAVIKQVINIFYRNIQLGGGITGQSLLMAKNDLGRFVTMRSYENLTSSMFAPALRTSDDQKTSFFEVNFIHFIDHFYV